MPIDMKAITEKARNLAEGAELAAALEASAPIVRTLDKSRESWLRRWLDLSDWARRRELRELERDLAESVEDLRRANEVAQARIGEVLQASAWADGFFTYVVECSDPQGTSEVSRRWAETKTYREDALQALKAAAESNNDYLEVKGAVTLAEARSQAARRHFHEVRRVRIRTAALSFVFTLVVLMSTALLLHYRFSAP
jgi:hypothetical protein